MLEERINYLSQINRLVFIDQGDGTAKKIVLNRDCTINHELAISLNADHTEVPIWFCEIAYPNGKAFLACDGVLDIAITKAEKLANQGGFWFI